MLIGIDASRAATRERTGTEGYAYYLIQALIPLAEKRGHSLRLYYNRAPAPDLFLEAAHVEHVTIPFPRLWTHARLGWELLRRPPDVFFTPAHVIPYTYRGRSVATVHDLGYHHFPEAHPGRQLAYLRWSTRHNGRVGSRLITISQTTRRDLIHLDGVNADKIDVIYPGVDPVLKPVSDEPALAKVQQKYGIRLPYLLSMGTLQPRKNLVRLVQAYAQSNVSHQLVLAGKPGWLSQPILNEVARQRSAGAGLRPAIALPGYIEETDKAALISGATALIFPSLYEGFGFPVLEAQACGTAVLCANTSSLPEIAGNGALLVDPLSLPQLTDGIMRIVSDNELRQQLVQHGFANVRRFSWEKTAVAVLHTLERAGD